MNIKLRLVRFLGYRPLEKEEECLREYGLNWLPKKTPPLIIKKDDDSYGPSVLEAAIPTFEAHNFFKDAYLTFCKPIPKYPSGGPCAAGPAIVGEVGPELVIGPDGNAHMTYSRLIEVPKGSKIVPMPSADL